MSSMRSLQDEKNALETKLMQKQALLQGQVIYLILYFILMGFAYKFHRNFTDLQTEKLQDKSDDCEKLKHR